MKKITLQAAILFTFLLFIAATIGNPAIPNPKDINDKIPVDEFSSVSISVNATVYIEQANTYSVEMDGPADVLEKIEIKVENEKLIIQPENHKTQINKDVTIRINAPDYEAISMAGSAKLVAEGNMNLEELTLKIAGSGSMKFNKLSAEEVEVKISGSGSLYLAGNGAGELSIAIAGSGDMDARNFEVDEMEVKISGSGSCKVYVTGELEASIAGSGSVYYSGAPQIESSVAGSGTVKKLSD